MRWKVLALLQERLGSYVSGEEISRQLGVSRAAIWKQVHKLQAEGYGIQSATRLGYRLEEGHDLLALLTQEKIGTTFLGQEIAYYVTLDSTNNEAKRLAAAGAPEGTLVLAEEQTGGKGRLGRHFVAPFAKGLWFSLVLRPKINLGDAVQLVMIAAVAVWEAVREHTGLAVEIKWPNDLLYQGKKLTGILLEMNGDMDRLNYLIMGIGINVNLREEDFPKALKDTATSLFLASGKIFSREKVLRLVLQKLERYYEDFTVGDMTVIVQKWKEASCVLGKQITVRTVKETLFGTAEDFTDEGALLLRLEDGSQAIILAGEATLNNS